MKPIRIFAVAAVSLLVLGIYLPAGQALEDNVAATTEVARVMTAGQVFTAAIMARNIEAMDKVWAHKPYATFIGPLSTSLVTGWEGVRKAWQMRFGQFDRVTIMPAETEAHITGKVAWTVGMEKVHLLRKDGKTLDLDAFVTNVFEDHDGRWLMVSHHATPVFKSPE